jgi:hypothetical protein
MSQTEHTSQKSHASHSPQQVIDAMRPQNKVSARQGDIIQPFTKLYMSYQGDPQRSIATVHSGYRYWYPTANSSRIKLELSFRGDQLTEGAYLKILTVEPQVGQQNVLGAFWDATELYYWTDTQGANQQWQVHALSGSGDKRIRYGDKVVLTNLHYSPQRLIARNGWLTTAEQDDSAFWVFEAP